MAFRTLPRDFIANARTMTNDNLRHHYACGHTVLTRWLKEAGDLERPKYDQRHRLRDMPDDFEDYANQESLADLAKRYKAGLNAVQRWRIELGAQVAKNPLRPMPDSFPATAPLHCRNELLLMYQCGAPVLDRWLAEAGVEAKKYVPINLSGGKNWIGRAAGVLTPTPQPQRDDSTVGEAADFLRRKGWVVFRARTIRAEAPKDDWIVGRLTLPTSEMVARAERGGFVRREMM